MRLLSILLLIVPTATAASPDPAVSLATGRLRGSALAQGGAVFKGIPYAQPPVGDLRWRPPVPVKPWSSERGATAFGPPCAQNSNGRMLANSSEDCLFLNVWT